VVTGLKAVFSLNKKTGVGKLDNFVVFFGYFEELASVFERQEIFLGFRNPSVGEGFSNPLCRMSKVGMNIATMLCVVRNEKVL
jgi:hypothetical protein